MIIQLIANPVAGGGRGKIQAIALQEALRAMNHDVEFTLTKAAGEAESASASSAECIAVVGGDGTLNEVINGVGDRPVPVAILPVGTANVVARELKMKSDPQRIAQHISDRRVRRVDVGVHGKRRFLLSAGAGLDAAIVAAVHENRGRRSGLAKWVAPAIRTALKYTYPKMRVTVDGETVSETAQYALIGNCRYSAGIFPATPKAVIDDGLLDVCLLHDLRPARIAALAVNVWRSTFTQQPSVTYRQGKHITIEPTVSGPIPLQIDGDPAGEIPAEFLILPKALLVITPTAQP